MASTPHSNIMKLCDRLSYSDSATNGFGTVYREHHRLKYLSFHVCRPNGSDPGNSSSIRYTRGVVFRRHSGDDSDSEWNAMTSGIGPPHRSHGEDDVYATIESAYTLRGSTERRSVERSTMYSGGGTGIQLTSITGYSSMRDRSDSSTMLPSGSYMYATRTPFESVIGSLTNSTSSESSS